MTARMLIGIGVLVSAACDSTGPGEAPVRITVSAEASAPTVEQIDEATVEIRCPVTFTASAAGAPNDVATWEGGELRWFIGLDRSTPVAVDALTGDDVAAIWQRTGMTPGDTAISSFLFSAAMPFSTELDFQYSSPRNRESRTASTSFTCGIGLDAPTPAAPTVSNLTVVTPHPFQPGDTFTVGFRARAAAGLWTRSIVLNGSYAAITILAENLLTDSWRSIEFIVPPGVDLDEPLQINVFATDALGRVAGPETFETATVVDVTPPTHGGPERIVGQYPTDETISLIYLPRDNHGLKEGVFEIAGERHSYALTGTDTIIFVGTVPRPEWVGAPSASFHVTDIAGLASDRAESVPDSFRIYPVVERAITTLQLDDAQELLAAAFDETRGLLYVGVHPAAEILVISPASMTIQKRIPLPGVPWGVDFTLDGDSLAVSLRDRNSIALVDLASDEVTEIPLDAVGIVAPRELALLANGRILLQGFNSMGYDRVALLDPGDPASAELIVASAGFTDITRTPDRATVALITSAECVFVRTAGQSTFSECIATGPIGKITVDHAGSRFLIGQNVLQPGGGYRPLTYGIAREEFRAFTFAADGESVFVSGRLGIYRIRVSDGAVLERIPMSRGDGFLFTTADGTSIIAVRNSTSFRDHVAIDRVTVQ